MEGDVQAVPATSEEIKELQELLHQNLKLAQDTNRLLHNMRKWGRISFWLKVLFWVIVLGLPLFALYSYLAPYARQITSVPGVSASSTSLFGLPSPSMIESQAEKVVNPGN